MKNETQLDTTREAGSAVAELQEKRYRSPKAPRGGLEVPPESQRTPSPEEKSQWEYERDVRYQTKINRRRTPEYVQGTRRTPEQKNYGSRTFDPTSTSRKGSNVTWRKIRKQLNQSFDPEISLLKKSEKYDISIDILKEVFNRGISKWVESSGFTPEQYAFNRVNSFIHGGLAASLDEDLKKACWKGYEAIGMKKKNGKMVPNCVPKEETAYGSNDMGTDSLVNKYTSMTPGQQSRAKLILKIAKEKNNV